MDRVGGGQQGALSLLSKGHRGRAGEDGLAHAPLAAEEVVLQLGVRLQEGLHALLNQ